MPAMQRIAEEYADKLLVLGVNWGEEDATVADFAERYGVTYPVLLDPGLEIYYDWAGTDGLPRHYFIGESGNGPARGHRSAGPRAHGRDHRRAARRIGPGSENGARMKRAPSSVSQREAQPLTTTVPFISGWRSHWK